MSQTITDIAINKLGNIDAEQLVQRSQLITILELALTEDLMIANETEIPQNRQNFNLLMMFVTELHTYINPRQRKMELKEGTFFDSKTRTDVSYSYYYDKNRIHHVKYGYITVINNIYTSLDFYLELEKLYHSVDTLFKKSKRETDLYTPLLSLLIESNEMYGTETFNMTNTIDLFDKLNLVWGQAKYIPNVLKYISGPTYDFRSVVLVLTISLPDGRLVDIKQTMPLLVHIGSKVPYEMSFDEYIQELLTHTLKYTKLLSSSLYISKRSLVYDY